MCRPRLSAETGSPELLAGHADVHNVPGCLQPSGQSLAADKQHCSNPAAELGLPQCCPTVVSTSLKHTSLSTRSPPCARLLRASPVRWPKIWPHRAPGRGHALLAFSSKDSCSPARACVLAVASSTTFRLRSLAASCLQTAHARQQRLAVRHGAAGVRVKGQLQPCQGLCLGHDILDYLALPGRPLPADSAHMSGKACCVPQTARQGAAFKDSCSPARACVLAVGPSTTFRLRSLAASCLQIAHSHQLVCRYSAHMVASTASSMQGCTLPAAFDHRQSLVTSPAAG